MRRKRRVKRKVKILAVLLLLAIIIGGGKFSLDVFQGKASADSLLKSTSSSASTTSSATVTNTASETDKTTTYVQAVMTTVESTPDDDSDDYIPIYSTASTSSSTVDQMFRGSWATYLATEGDFYKVKTSDGNVGYIEIATAKKGDYTVGKTVDSLSDVTIVLDPGHGGEDVGSLDNSETIYEKTLTLKTAKVVEKTLKAAGVNVVMTRTTSSEYTSLSDIASLTNKNNANLFISFHYDNSDYANEAEGFTTYYYYKGASKKFANAIHSELANNNTLYDRGVNQENYQVIRDTYVPSILLELGYLNNDSDLATMNTATYRQMVADSVLAGIKDYYNLD